MAVGSCRCRICRIWNLAHAVPTGGRIGACDLARRLCADIRRDARRTRIATSNVGSRIRCTVSDCRVVMIQMMICLARRKLHGLHCFFSRKVALILIAAVALISVPAIAQAASLSPSDLDQLVARNALYPDPLLAKIPTT
jgi:hypothetical protein